MFSVNIYNFWTIHKLHYKVNSIDTVLLSVWFLKKDTGKNNNAFYESYESLFLKSSIFIWIKK